MSLVRFFRRPGPSRDFTLALLSRSDALESICEVDTEYCYYVQFCAGTSYNTQSDDAKACLHWLLAETFDPAGFGSHSFLVSGESAEAAPSGRAIVEVGPRLSFTSAFSTNATSIMRNCGLPIERVERYRRYAVASAAGSELSPRVVDAFAAAVHDRMTEWRLTAPLTTFDALSRTAAPVRTIPLLTKGRAALEAINHEMGLSFDTWDLDFYLRLFTEDLRRDPTDVELFDISQSNSEHSRHWFFKGKIVIDGIEQPRTLMSIVQDTLAAHPDNSIVAFADNSSAIKGFEVPIFCASRPGVPSALIQTQGTRHCLLTAETHNFPTGVAPYPGAETGTGGRIRDTHATGRGSHVVAGTAAYCVGNLRIPGYDLPWEDPTFEYPASLASPLAIEIDASNGASDYGNKFGEPVIAGFTRSVGLRLSNGERREYIKPIMFTAGVGAIDDAHVRKGEPNKGMLVVKLGGPAYRIGMGGSAASSMMQGENKVELDFNAVQRGDAEMEQKVNRVIRACCELGARNPIISIHDQGAGGNCNVLKEIVSPAGGRIDIRAVLVGDVSLSVLEIWGAEYQEADALLINPDHREIFASMCERERAPMAVVGEVTGDGRVVVFDSSDSSTPVDMDIDKVLGNMPQKVFAGTHAPLPSSALSITAELQAALDRVLRLLAVGSKRFLTNKVDRSVTGLVAQQQCVGPLHTPLADCAVVALGYTATVGTVTSIGEQPLKGLLSPAAMARMAVAEAVTNMAAARITALSDAKCSANWMWAAKLPHEGPRLYEACEAMGAIMTRIGIAVDGGKDSLSMAAKTPSGEMVKAPGSLVISLYAPCPDITMTMTPDLKGCGDSTLLLLRAAAADAAALRWRLSGSALAQVFNQVGAIDDCPDCDDPDALLRAFNVVQKLLQARLLLSVHDCSDGGLLVAALEMAFAGNVGLDVVLPCDASDALRCAFAEEVGILVEVSNDKLDEVQRCIRDSDVAVVRVGYTRADARVTVRTATGGKGAPALVDDSVPALRNIWESTSFELEKLQCAPACAAEEQRGLASRKAPPYSCSFLPRRTAPEILARAPSARPRTVVLREEGSNGDRELAAAFFAAGFDVWDVTMSDLLAGRFHIDSSVRGIAFPGGFSYADVLDSAKGWAGVIRFHPAVLAQFTEFYARRDTFSLGVCNGCQLAALLGWVPFGPLGSVGGVTVSQKAQPRFIHNASGRFESRFSTVRIEPSPAIMFKGMAGSVLGVWVAHGEGQAHFPDPAVLDAVLAHNLAPLRYVNDEGVPTTQYPLNPNGSPHGIAGLCSPDGRHLALMPHPERVHELWQFAWMPRSWREGPSRLEASPWLRMFQNAYEWCVASAAADASGAT